MTVKLKGLTALPRGILNHVANGKQECKRLLERKKFVVLWVETSKLFETEVFLNV